MHGALVKRRRLQETNCVHQVPLKVKIIEYEGNSYDKKHSFPMALKMGIANAYLLFRELIETH